MLYKLLAVAVSLASLSAVDAYSSTIPRAASRVRGSDIQCNLGRRELFASAAASVMAFGVSAPANAQFPGTPGRKADQSAIGVSRVPPLSKAKGNPGAGIPEVPVQKNPTAQCVVSSGTPCASKAAPAPAPAAEPAAAA